MDFKKWLIFSNLLTITALVYVLVAKPSGTQVPDNGTSSATATPVTPVGGGPALPGESGTPCSVPVYTATADFEIPTDLAKRMVTKYSTDHWQALYNATSPNPGSRYVDSRSVWFSISKLQGFIDYVKLKAGSSPLSAGGCCGDLGIRFYFAEYDNYLTTAFGLGETIGGYNNYENKTTLLLVPTFKWTNQTNHDFNPLNTTQPLQFGCNVIDTPGWPGGGTMLAMTMNHGGICPPPWPVIQNVTTNCSNNNYLTSGADFMLQKIDQDPQVRSFILSLPSSGSGQGGCND